MFLHKFYLDRVLLMGLPMWCGVWVKVQSVVLCVWFRVVVECWGILVDMVERGCVGVIVRCRIC